MIAGAPSQAIGGPDAASEDPVTRMNGERPSPVKITRADGTVEVVEQTRQDARRIVRKGYAAGRTTNAREAHEARDPYLRNSRERPTK